MPKSQIEKSRKRVVVEEVGTPVPAENEIKSSIVTDKPIEASQPIISDQAASIEVVNEPQTEKKSPSIVLWILIPGIFLLGAILGGIVFYQKGISKGEDVGTTNPSPTSTVQPSASPSAQVDLTKYTVAVYNGSGIAGEAGKVKTLLITAGFKVGVTTNAATYDYTKTIIKAKSTVDAAFVTALSTALDRTYVVDTAQTLADSSKDDVQVVVGSSKAQ